MRIEDIENMDAPTLAPIAAAVLRRWSELGRDLAREVAAVDDPSGAYDEAHAWLTDIVDEVPLD